MTRILVTTPCAELDAPKTQAQGTLYMALCVAARCMLENQATAKSLASNTGVIHWQQQLIELIDCAERYLGTPARQALQTFIAGHPLAASS